VDAHVAQVVVGIALDKSIYDRSTVGQRCGDCLALRIHVAMYLSCLQANFLKQEVFYPAIYAFALFFLLLVLVGFFRGE
jgi:hypothetical protein